MRYPICLAFFVTFISFNNLNAQSIIGSWKDAYGNQIYLNEDYKFDYFTDESQYTFGQFAIQNNILTLYFTMENSYAQYQVAVISDSQLSWTTATGQSFVVTKVPSRKAPTTPGEIAAERSVNDLYYKTMMDMNNQIHVTNLNIIENMGGTGNYWKIEDY